MMAVNRFKFKKSTTPNPPQSTAGGASEPVAPVWTKTTFNEDMELLERIGEGRWSSVHTCEPKPGRESPFSAQCELAVKIVEKSRLNEHDKAALKAEVAILRGITHPNIMRVFEVHISINIEGL